MLYLRTGGNGSGKTLLTLKDVRALQLETGRPVCINIRPATDEKKPNQPYCNIKAEKLEEFGWKKIRFEDWEAQDDNTIFLIDECHYDLPVRSTKVPPPHIQRLTEHRSRGFDFFLLTQHPKNIDSFVRNLVQAPGWHEHIKRIGGALPVAQFHQWDAVKLQCEAFGSAKDANSKTRPYPTEVYTWYDSATIHTGRKRIPWRVWFILIAPMLILWLFWSGFSQVGKGSTGKQSSAAAETVSARSNGGAAANHVKTPAEYVASYQPRIPALLHTAPVYDGLTVPKRVPVPAACVEMPSKGCKCYTQDATPYPVDLAMCRQIVAHGVFLAFQAEGELAGRNQVQPQPVKAQEPVQAAPSASPGLVLIGGGIPAAPNPPAAVPAPATQARVQPGSKWSFTTGGQ
ncbi:zonular occludens toxin domain-containing protein [Variovorax guangxiensis]|uniref:Zona occludens toxin n=1 Tax=Variovorax guangxiensis TaxID=1775474 RepID=A0A840G1Z9_9BURK|nr:zonular occludens toxin domain-containing protein [Variovorax guangxiensis]MBB4225609.1 zona occludens toxin [Variovorax guangxiensis]